MLGATVYQASLANESVVDFPACALGYRTASSFNVKSKCGRNVRMSESRKLARTSRPLTLTTYWLSRLSTKKSSIDVPAPDALRNKHNSGRVREPSSMRMTRNEPAGKSCIREAA